MNRLSATCLASALLAGHALFAAAAATSAARPNVVVFLADDAGWGDYSHSGNTMVRTPHIDSLARDGVSFDRFYVCPLCSPTRAEFLTGRYYLRTGVRGVSTGHERLNLDERTVADAFRTAGYATGAFGKWHNGSQWPYHPMARGFDTYYGHTSGHWGEYFDPPLERDGRMEQAKGYIVDACTDEALAFIERNRQRPFFCYVPFTTPHSPWAAPAKDWQRFKDMPIAQSATRPNLEVPDETRCALAMMENQDWNVGRVLRKLDDLRLADNTIVLYFSDNGPNSWRWNGGMAGKKGGTDEGSVRSVCFFRWPARLPRGRTVREIAGAIDLLPTLTALAGVPRVGDKPLDGLDLSPLLLGQPAEWPDRILFSAWNGNVSPRTQRHRMAPRGALFDMVDDPGQTRDIASQQPDVAQRLSQAADVWRTEMYGTSDAMRESRDTVDPRPIGVGYPEFPVTMLPARDGVPRGCVQRSSGAPNCSYFVNWTNLNGEIVWQVDVQTPGAYDVTLDYTCPLADAGSRIELAFNGSVLSGHVTPGWDPPLNTNQDTVPRPKGESQMKPFRSLALGTITLAKGAGALTLRAREMTGTSVMDLRRLTLTLRSDTPRPRLGINLAGPADWMTELPFVDVFRTSRPWISQRQGASWGKGPELALDDLGWVKHLEPDCYAETMLCTIPGGHYPSGVYTVLYAGEGTLTAGLNAKTKETARGKLLLDVDASKGGFSLRLTATNPENPVRDIRVVMPGFTDIFAEDPFHPAFLKRWKGFACLRFMDWMHTNGSEIRTWADRPTLRHATFSKRGVALEWMIDLSNRLGIDPWFCMPHMADDDFVRQFAREVKERLDPTLNVYIEYSNEVWNGQFAQCRYAGERGIALGLGPKERPWEAGWAYTARRSLEIFAIWESVFGGHTRLVRVIPTQSANIGVTQGLLRDPEVARRADALAIAPYMGYNIGRGKTAELGEEMRGWNVERMLTHFEETGFAESLRHMRMNKELADRHGLRLIAYEGGQHMVAFMRDPAAVKDVSALMHACNRHPRMGELYTRYYDEWAAIGGDLFAVFSSIGHYSNHGAWGLAEFHDSTPADSPKLAATLKWAKARGQPVMAAD